MKRCEFQAANGPVAIEITGTYTDGSKDVSLTFDGFCRDFSEIDQVECIFEQLSDWGCVFPTAKVAWANYMIAQGCLMDGESTPEAFIAEADAMDLTEAEEFCDWHEIEVESEQADDLATITVTFSETYAGKLFRTFHYCVGSSNGELSEGLDSCETFTAAQAEAVMDAVKANAEAERLTFPYPEAVSFFIEVG